MVDPVRFKYIEGQASVKWSEDGGVRGSREDTLTSLMHSRSQQSGAIMNCGTHSVVGCIGPSYAHSGLRG